MVTDRANQLDTLPNRSKFYQFPRASAGLIILGEHETVSLRAIRVTNGLTVKVSSDSAMTEPRKKTANLVSGKPEVYLCIVHHLGHLEYCVWACSIVSNSSSAY